MQSALALFGVIAFTAFGQLIIKARTIVHMRGAHETNLSYLLAMLTDFWVLSGLAAADLAALCWMVALQKLDLSFAYPFLALSFVLVPLCSALLFHERLPILQLVGLGLIVAGVIVSTLSR